MQLKLDENLGLRPAELLRKAGHNVATVPEQKLCSASDRTLIGICQKEKRCPVTLDIDFGNPLLFQPSSFSGIVVLRLPHKPTPDDLDTAIETLIGNLVESSVEGKLWIVQKGRIREYQPANR